MPVDFDFTEEQYALRDLARDVFAREWPSARLRELWEGKEPDGSVWRTLAEVGIAGLTVPEAQGGSGGDLLDLVLVLEEAGRVALAEPLVETAAVAAPVLAAFGGEAQFERLSRIASGAAVVSVLAPGAPFALDADQAEAVLVLDGEDLHLVPEGAFTSRALAVEDRARRLFAVEAQTSSATRVGGVDAVALARRLGAVATAVVLNGVSSRLLETTVDYVRERQQFGRPVGSFQAVKHKLADVHADLEAARAAAWYAAYSLARGLPDADLATSVAKASSAEAGARANAEALQCHGGIGFTWEHDLHLWLKRGKALEAAYGTAAEHRSRLAEHLLAEPAS